MVKTSKSKALKEFKKAQYFVAKAANMIEQNRYCVDIMQTNLVAINLLRSAHKCLLENNLGLCFEKNKIKNVKVWSNKASGEVLKVVKMFDK